MSELFFAAMVVVVLAFLLGLSLGAHGDKASLARRAAADRDPAAIAENVHFAFHLWVQSGDPDARVFTARICIDALKGEEKDELADLLRSLGFSVVSVDVFDRYAPATYAVWRERPMAVPAPSPATPIKRRRH